MNGGSCGLYSTPTLLHPVNVTAIEHVSTTRCTRIVEGCLENGGENHQQEPLEDQTTVALPAMRQHRMDGTALGGDLLCQEP
jgi:hypothetical protein